MDWLPPGVTAAAILAGLAIPGLLVALSFGPKRWRHPGRRFRVSVIGGWLLWVPLVLVLPGETHPLDWLAGAAVLIAATLLSFNVWTVLAYGVTVNMLVALMRSERPLDLDDWADRYSAGRSLNQIFRDRLGHLLWAGLVTQDGDQIRAIPSRSRVVIAILRVFNFVFGLQRR